MLIDVSIICIFAALILGYLLGSISPGIIIGKLIFKKDPRDFGSGNSGGTNVGRLFGKKVGLIVIILDALKTIISILATFFILKYAVGETILFMDPSYYSFIAGIGASLGHTFPIFNKFKGGKAVSCYLGIMVSLNWGLTLVLFFVFMIILKLKKMVSLASCVTSGVAFLFALIPIFKYTMNFGITYDIFYILFILFGGLFVIIRHKENIKRIIRKEERKITWL